MVQIRIRGSEERILCEQGSGFLSVLLEKNVFVDNPCNGTGVCGKCKVRVYGADAAVSKMEETERSLLKPEEIASGIRLACMTSVYGDIEVELLKQERQHRVLTGGVVPEFVHDIDACGYGVAVDIGTTTVVLSLIDMQSGEEIATASRINAQKQFGLDVLTRITYEYEHGESGIRELQKAIVGCLNEMLEDVCGDPICREEIREIVVAANCTMTHMLLGVDARQIGRAPYEPVFREAKSCLASEIGLRVGKTTKLYCLPQVSSYIGADIVAGVHVCRLEKESGHTLFIDIGTNGEIVLVSDGKMLSCSCAAGPALEGMNISCGMRAADGAVEEIRMSEKGVELTVIGNRKPEGLCGSGILAAVRELIKNGFLKKTGALIQADALKADDWRKNLVRAVDGNGKKREVLLNTNPDLVVTQDDIRQVQLAKGAILSGFTALLKKAGIKMEDLDRVLIAGQFGAHLPVESLVGVGILPEQIKDKIVYVGNSSKTGAYMALLSKKERAAMELLAKKIDYFELAESDDYERIFAECMRFPVRSV